jgi:hypothetical protein
VNYFVSHTRLGVLCFQNQIQLTIKDIVMPLTIGVKRYDGSRGRTLADLYIGNPRLVERLQQEFPKAEDLARANLKLSTWVSTPWYNALDKKQGKCFAGINDVVIWLKYKTNNRALVQSKEDESRLASAIDQCPGIRRTVGRFTTQVIPLYFNSLDAETRRRLKDTKGRYARFYSKSFYFNRSLSEGVSYFKDQRDPSLSEMAAFLSDLALALKDRDPDMKAFRKMTQGHDELRMNKAEIDLALAILVAENERKLSRGVLADQAKARQQVNKLFEDLQRDIPWDQLDNHQELKELVSQTEIKLRLPSGSTGQAFYESNNWAQAKRTFLARNTIESVLNRQFEQIESKAGQRRQAFPETLREQATTKVSRSAFNVDPSHEWTRLMMQKNVMIGAGPSSTTAHTLSLVAAAVHRLHPYFMNGTEKNQLSYSVAMALFAFWQRKKMILSLASAVHTWNEVVAALEPYQTLGTPFMPPVAEDFSVDNPAVSAGMHCKVYEYPDRFQQTDGRPLFNNVFV